QPESWRDDPGRPEAAPDRPVDRPASFLAEHKRQRAFSAKAALLVQDGYLVLAQCLLKAVACGVAIQSRDPLGKVMDRLEVLGQIQTAGADLRHYYRAVIRRPCV